MYGIAHSKYLLNNIPENCTASKQADEPVFHSSPRALLTTQEVHITYREWLTRT